MIQHDHLIQMYTALDADGRRYLLGVLQMEYDRVQTSRRPVLRLVKSVPDAPLRASTTTAQGGASHG